ncbi:MAG TPA: putative lipid II flippase FtsW [Ktedonobacteraceae bacterium]|nr:putative lipid II flippase FtsW [Ktedonobacteraceae bacterium]
MPRENGRQLNRLGEGRESRTRLERQRGQRDQKPLVMRSPALEALEGQRTFARAGASRMGAGARRSVRIASASRRGASGLKGTLARLATPASPRKSLPRARSTAAVSSPEVIGRSSGKTGGWRLWEREQEDASAQVISEEEQKKLAELEMRLPRVAGKIDPWLLVITLALLCIGLVMVYSASSFIAARYYGDPSYFFQRQLWGMVVGLAAMLVTMRVDYRVWRRFSLIGMAIVLPLLVIVLKFGVTVYGASRWLAFGSFFSFQPSELTKLVLALYIADWLARKGNQVGTFLYGLAPFVILVGLILGLILLENDMGTAIIIAGMATVMFFTAGANIMQFLLAMVGGGLIFMKEAFSGYRALRLLGFLNPFSNVTGYNMQLYQSLLALGSGGWFGVGLGASRQKTGYLPMPYTDSIMAIIGEELGLLGSAIIVILFLCLAFRGFRLARRTQDMYGALLATGITTWLVLQAMINIGATTGTIPYTGVPLPFISYGSSSLVVSMAAIGVLLNISRYIREPEMPALRRTLTMGMHRKKA